MRVSLFHMSSYFICSFLYSLCILEKEREAGSKVRPTVAGATLLFSPLNDQLDIRNQTQPPLHIAPGPPGRFHPPVRPKVGG